ncbi:hypothetical protein V6Z12_D10G059700 [Gossypium hirsutum]
MSFVKGDLLTKTRKLVNGLAKPQPVWLKAMEQISAYDPPPARLFGLRVLELKELGVTEEEAVAVADGNISSTPGIVVVSCAQVQ